MNPINYIERIKDCAKAFSKQKEEQKHKVKVVPLDFALAIVKEMATGSIQWSVEDFRERAKSLYEWYNDVEIDNDEESWKEMYDEDKFESALERMVNDHDCNDGITWGTIDAYLDSDCKKS